MLQKRLRARDRVVGGTHVLGGGGEGGTGGGDDDAEGEGILFDEEFDDNNYPGPHFEDLDKGVQDAFLSYLA